MTADTYAVGEIAWQRNFNKAKELAKQTGKPMLLDFTASWCGPCKKMEAEVWNQPEIVAAAAKFVPVAVDIDSDSGTAGRYNANPIPLIVVTDPWGNVLNRNSGYMSAHRLSKMLAPVPADFSPVAEQMATLARNEKNAPALVRVGEFYVNIGALDMGNVYFERALKTDAAKTDEKLRGNLLFAIGLNHWRLRPLKKARKILRNT
jgi:thiol-disulfide isomerase/thioredoxin